jgi:hypothetical protein
MKVEFMDRGGYLNQTFMGAKVEPSKAKKEVPIKSKGKFDTQPLRNHDIKYFRCLEIGDIVSQYPNKKVMILKDHDDIEYESDRFEEDEMPPFKYYSDEDVEYSVEGEYLDITHTHNVQIKKDDVEQQMTNIFYT